MATDTLVSPAIIGSSTKTKTYKNFIDGEWVESSTGETFENRNPADTREVVGIFQKSGKDDVNAAVDCTPGNAPSPASPAGPIASPSTRSPCSTSIEPPTVPGCTSRPSRPRGSCPDVRARPPCNRTWRLS